MRHRKGYPAPCAPAVKLRGQLGIRCGYPLLQVDGALHSLDRAGGLNQYAAARDLKHPAPVARDQRLQDFAPAGLQHNECVSFVVLHEATVADRIGGKNGGESALGAFFSHRVQSPPENATPNCMAAPPRSLLGRTSGLNGVWDDGKSPASEAAVAVAISPWFWIGLPR